MQHGLFGVYFCTILLLHNYYYAARHIWGVFLGLGKMLKCKIMQKSRKIMQNYSKIMQKSKIMPARPLLVDVLEQRAARRSVLLPVPRLPKTEKASQMRQANSKIAKECIKLYAKP